MWRKDIYKKYPCPNIGYYWRKVMNREELSMLGFEIVAYAGDARSSLMTLLKEVRNGNFDNIEKYLKDADEEGFHELAEKFRAVAAIEKTHEERYLKLVGNIEDNLVFQRGEEKIWICRNCGHIHVGETAPAVCPICKHPQSFMEIKAENY